jgi:dipeptidyl aminopeptidase/acylaminoacyl peptidase
MRSILLSAVLLAGVSASSQSLKMVEPADIAGIRAVTEPRIAPDGRHVVYVVNTPVEPGAPANRHIWIASTEGAVDPHPYILSGGVDSDPRWSPNGKSLAFLSTRKNPLSGTVNFTQKLVNAEGHDDLKPAKESAKNDAAAEEPQLWLLPAAGGEAQPLTDLPGGIKQIEWSRDGRFIAFVRRDIDTPKEREDKLHKIDQEQVDANYKFDRLWVYELATHQARLVTRTDTNIDDYSWSPDGKQLLARVSPTPRIDDYWRVSKIVLLDAASGAVTRIIEEHAGYATPRFSPDGRHLTYSRMRPLHITDEHILLDLATGKSTLFESFTSGTVEQMEWTPDGRAVIAEVVEGTHTLAIMVDVAAGTATRLAESAGVAPFEASFSFSEDGSKIAYLANSFTSATDVWLLSGGKSARLTDTNPQVAQWKLGTQREISWKNTKDGKLVYGIVVLPPDYTPGKRYKTVVHVHGGPEEAWTAGWHGSWYDYAALLSSQGYVVLLPNPRGSDGQGPAFTEGNYKDWGGGDFADVQSGVDYLIAQGIADPDKLVIGGWSFGGFMTAWTVTHTDRYKAAMVGAGVTDLFSMATTTDIAPSFEDGYLGVYAGNFKSYDLHSPIRSLDQCHTPVLVLHGGADKRVPLSQGQEFYYGLRFLGRETQMVVYPREPHIFGESAHQIDSLQRILDWYASHLK